MKILVFISVLALSAMASVVPVEEKQNVPVPVPEEPVEMTEAETMEVVELEMAEESSETYPYAESDADLQIQPRACDYGWHQFGSRCFKLVEKLLGWHDAEDHCHFEYDAHLATVFDHKEQRRLKEMLTQHSTVDAWLGGFYLQSKWRWIDGKESYFPGWESNPSVPETNPSCPYSSAACMRLGARGFLVTPCSIEDYFFCAK